MGSERPPFPVFVVRHHRLVFTVGLLIPILAGIIIASFNLFEFTPTSGRDFRVRDNTYSERDDMESRALEAVSVKDDTKDKDEPKQTQLEGAWTIFLIYSSQDDKTVFEKDRIQHMKKWEDKILDNEDRKKFCLMDGTTDGCHPTSSYLSSVPHFYPQVINATTGQSIPNGKGDLVSNPDDVVKALAEPKVLDLFSEFFFSRNFTKDNRVSKFTRAAFFYGAPLVDKNGNKFKNKDDKELEQRALYDEYAVKIRNDVLDNAKFSGEGSMDTYVYSGRLNQREFQVLTDHDLTYAIGSICFVLFYLGVHTRSAFLACFGMLEILLSFPLSYIIYRVVFGITFFQALHSLAIFLILGVGADNIFVLFDAWMQAGLYPELAENDEKRMEWAFNRASKAMFVTSFTTMAAFLVTGTSNIMPIATFGIFAGFLIASNYWMVVTFMPSAIMEWHLTFQTSPVFSTITCRKQRNTDIENTENTTVKVKTLDGDEISASEVNVQTEKSEVEDLQMDVVQPFDPSELDSDNESVSDGEDHWESHPNNDKKSDVRVIDIVDDTPEPKSTSASTSVNKTKPKSTSIVLMDMDDSPAKSNHQPGQGHLEMDVESLRTVEMFFYRTWSPFILKYHKYILVFFTVLLIVAVSVASQMQPLTKQEQWYPDYYPFGKAQNALQDGFLQSDEDGTVEVRFLWGLQSIDRAGTTQYDPNDIGNVKYDDDFDPSPKANQKAIYDTCLAAKSKDFVRKANVKCFMLDYRDWALDTYNQFPVNFSDNAADQKKMFEQSLLTFSSNTTYRKYLTGKDLGFVDGNLKFLRVGMASDLKRFSPFLVVLPIRDQFEKFVTERNDASPKGVNQAVQTAGFEYGWAATQMSFVTNAISGMAISITVAFIVLIISTQNMVVGSLATLTIVGIVSSTLAVMVGILQWQLGVTESISAVILIGFSVDYVVHLGNSYTEAEHVHTRYEKMRSAVTDMGVSVVAGATTTLFSSLFLFGGIILFFFKFGVLILTTISLSLFWSTCFFLSSMVWIGPENGYGDIKNLIAKCKGEKK